ncbi:terpene synthase family protein [Nocardia sp. NPDC052566]|uniref:terpene synthase family protein n=1 Tax=Nocardia sp. NPDC052566 TaxID=3364330 RepID=UPI0037C7D63F
MARSQLDRLLEPGAQYRLPDPVCSTAAKVNPDYPTIYERNAAWVRTFLPFPDERALSHMLEDRYPLWESLVYPTGLPARVVDSSCITSLMFAVDDVALLAGALFDDIAADWMADHPYGRAFADIWTRLKLRMPEGVYRRYRQEWQDWFTYALKENEYRVREEIPDVETYLEIRRINVGLRPYLVCAEYVLDLDLTDLIAADPDLAALQPTAVEHAMLVNDLFSFRWECFRGDYFNTIAPLIHTHGHSLQHAIDITCDKISAADRALTDLSAMLRRRYADHPDRTQLHDYIGAANAFCAGNLRWSLETTRYNGHGYGWNGLRSGLVTLRPDRTDIT